MIRIKWRNIEQTIIHTVCIIAALVASLMLLLIISHIFINAIPALSMYFIFTPESETPKIGQGIANAIVGTVIISLTSTILATPIAIGTAIYLQRYAKNGRAVRFFRYLIEVLSGTPSIVLGIFGLLLIAIYLGPFTGGFSLISGSIALMILIIPVIERAAEDAIQGTDRLLEEGSYALGATKWETLRNITIPTALSGILTGVILGFGRAAEESAVVILTAGYSQFMPEFAIRHNEKFFTGFKVYPFQDVIGTLPYSVYHAYENSNVIPLSNGFAAAFVLICIVMIINLSAKTVLWYSSRSKKSSNPLITSLKRTLFGKSKEKKPVTFLRPEEKATLHVRRNTVPPPSPPRVRDSSIDWHAAPAQPVRPASPYTSIESGENPHPLPAAKGRPGMHPEGRLYPDGTTQCYPATDPISGLPREQRVAPASCTALSDLFEDGPPGGPVDGEYGGSAGPGGDTLLSEDLPLDLLCRHFLMEEAEEIPFRENWRNMTRNREENTHV